MVPHVTASATILVVCSCKPHRVVAIDLFDATRTIWGTKRVPRMWIYYAIRQLAFVDVALVAIATACIASARHVGSQQSCPKHNFLAIIATGTARDVDNSCRRPRLRKNARPKHRRILITNFLVRHRIDVQGMNARIVCVSSLSYIDIGRV